MPSESNSYGICTEFLTSEGHLFSPFEPKQGWGAQVVPPESPVRSALCFIPPCRVGELALSQSVKHTNKDKDYLVRSLLREAS